MKDTAQTTTTKDRRRSSKKSKSGGIGPSSNSALRFVYIVQHVHKITEDNEDIKFVGVYSTQRTAREAVSRLRRAEGFRDHPRGFYVGKYEIDKDHWIEGFITVP